MKDKVLIWGTGAFGDLAWTSINLNKCDLLGAIDMNKEKQGKYWKDDYVIFSPKILETLEYNYLLIAIKNYQSALDECKKYNVDDDKIVIIADEKSVEKCEFIDKNIIEIRREIIFGIVKGQLHLENSVYEYGLRKIPIVKSGQELLKRIIKERTSLCRFGDGELELMAGQARPWFQDVNEQLAARLKEVFNSNNERVLIALSNNFGNLDMYTEQSAYEIREYLHSSGRKRIMSQIDMNREYYDAYISRPYLMFKDKAYAESIFGLLKEVWKERDILMVEGEYMRTGIGNDLFSTAKSVRRIICPSKNAFSHYTEILECIMCHVRKNDLVLLGLGPTATVLAYDIEMLGIQAIDIGQIDNEYEWYQMGAKERVKIPGKAVPELKDSHEVKNHDSDDYTNQIVAKVRC